MPRNPDDLIIQMRNRQQDAQLFHDPHRELRTLTRGRCSQDLRELTLMLKAHGADIAVADTEIAPRSIHVRQVAGLKSIEEITGVFTDLLFPERLNADDPGALKLEVHRIDCTDKAPVLLILGTECAVSQRHEGILGPRIARRTEAREHDEQAGHVAGLHTSCSKRLLLTLYVRIFRHRRDVEQPPVIPVAAQDDRALRKILQGDTPDLIQAVVLILGQRPNLRKLQPVTEGDIALKGQQPVIGNLLQKFRSIVATELRAGKRMEQQPDDKPDNRHQQNQNGMKHHQRFLR